MVRHVWFALLAVVGLSGQTPEPTTSGDAAQTLVSIQPSLAIVENSTGVGTAFCIGSDDEGSFYLTNARAVGADTTVTIYRQSPEYRKLGGIVVARGLDLDPDLAVVKVSEPHIPALGLEAGDLQAGRPVALAAYPVAYAVGSLAGPIAPSVRTGTISAIENRGGLIDDDVQTVAGNGGGPLFDPGTGAVVGVVDAISKSATGGSVGIGIARVVVPFLARHAIAYALAAPHPKDLSGPVAPQAAAGVDSSAPSGAGLAAVFYDNSDAGYDDVAAGIKAAAIDFARKFGERFHVRTIAVGLRVPNGAAVGLGARDNGASIGISYAPSLRLPRFSAPTSDVPMSTRWEFSLAAGLFDSYGTRWGDAPRIGKVVYSNHNMETIVESSLADLNDRAIDTLATDPFAANDDVEANLFRYALPMATGSTSAFFGLSPSSNGARAALAGDFSSAAQAGLQNGDLVEQMNGESLDGKSQDDLDALVKAIADAGKTYDLSIEAADGKKTHLIFDAKPLRWYVDHRAEGLPPAP